MARLVHCVGCAGSIRAQETCTAESSAAAAIHHCWLLGQCRKVLAEPLTHACPNGLKHASAPHSGSEWLGGFTVSTVQAASEAERPALQSHLQPLLDITATHLDGTAAYARQIGNELFTAFLDVEELFQRGSDATEQEIIDELRHVSTIADLHNS